MRLIDVDKLIEELCHLHFVNDISMIDIEKIYDCINNQPTAYDVNQVEVDLKCQADMPMFEIGVLGININTALDIIKRGGVK